ncbi:c3hc zinc finger protein [Metarhizium guizhouense ARSEF 977]|uniref:C3hc zinc finger protein n=1 Tax=Metarhizium guizhouense (strain ARSEF 977) TaxID=1276136 RepID=A0A0B4HLF8_METGA|nr:c3hc zinc finger protein [Metarhizium guizhouense ARSEF 977]
MNATKRKFKDLLQGLSSPGPTSPDKEADKMSSSPRYGTGTASNDTILQKRRRLGFPESMTPTLYSPSHTTTFSNVVLRKSSSQLNSKATSHSPAKYCPGDRDELLKRLATFQEITDWTPKPDKVNEIEWAKRGWICQGKEKVRCVLCHKELVVKLNRKEEEGKEVPVLVSSEIDEVDIDNVLSQLPPDFFSEPPPVVDKSGAVATDKPPNRAALALALMGWQGLTNSRIGPVPNSASCHTCLRRLGLWMFKSKEVDEVGQVVVPAPMDHLDPLREHRFFCPWKNPQAQSRGGVMSNGKDSLTGWRTLVQTIKNESDLRNLYSGKPKRTGQLQEQRLASPSPVRGMPGTPGSPSPITPGPKMNIDASSTGTPQTNAGDDEEKTREAKDKERWARLRKVKSLFDTKGSRKFRRELGRPGTGHSNKSTTGT